MESYIDILIWVDDFKDELISKVSDFAEMKGSGKNVFKFSDPGCSRVN